MRIALLGAGQLGGSFALALKQAPEAITITAYDAITAHAETLRANDAVDDVALTPEAAVKGADIVIFASPLRTYRALATAIAPVLAADTIVTDLGSVKTSMAQLKSLLPNARIVPGHPIAGSEKSGPAAARGDLFRGKLCILTPDAQTDADALQIIEMLWHVAGADVLHMPVEVHDQVYAYVSHLPHFIAFVAASYLHDLGASVDAGDSVLQQFLRISRSNARMWTDIALENREALLPVMGTYIALLEHFATELRAGEPTPDGDKIAMSKNYLPRVLAASLISSVSLYEQQADMSLRPFGAGGMRDMVAPAAQAPEADTEVISNHAATMAALIEGIIPRFRALEVMIGAEDEPALFAALNRMADEAHALVKPRN